MRPLVIYLAAASLCTCMALEPSGPRGDALPPAAVSLCAPASSVDGGRPTLAHQAEPRRPYFEADRQQTQFLGPGREDPEPADLTEIRLGWFGPSDPNHPEGGDLWLAASLAIEEANTAGGYRGLPFRLIPAWSDNPWSAGVAQVAKVVFGEKVWALIGSIDGPSTHLAEQVIVKAWVTLINPAATDPSVNCANVAWMFSLPPDDDRLAAALAPAVLEAADGKPFAMAAATDHDSHLSAASILKALSGRGAAPAHHFEFQPATGDVAAIADRIAATGLGTVALVAGAADSARAVTALRARSPNLKIFGGPAMERRIFAERAGAAAEGVVFPRTCDSSMQESSFARAFFSRFGRAPDCAAAQAYDAVRMVVEAVRLSGANRARIRDAVFALSPWAGVSGPVRWNPLNQNERPVTLSTIKDGRPAP